MLDDKDKAVKGFADERLYAGPTLTRDTDTNQKLIGTGLFKKKTEANLEKTFAQLVDEGLIISGEKW